MLAKFYSLDFTDAKVIVPGLLGIVTALVVTQWSKRRRHW
jgi:hypothetical protein